MIFLEFGGLQSCAIVDTGADISIMAEELYNQIPQSNKGSLKGSKFSNGNVVGISGNPLTSLGVAEIKFKIGPTLWNIPFEIVRGISRTALLGSDFLAKSQAQLDFYKRTLRLGDFVALMHRKDNTSKVALAQMSKKESISPCSRTTLIAQLTGEKLQGPRLITTLENSPLFFEQPGFMFPNIIAEINEAGQLPIEIVNSIG